MGTTAVLGIAANGARSSRPNIERCWIDDQLTTAVTDSGPARRTGEASSANVVGCVSD